MKRKTWLSLFLVFALLLGLAGCAGDPTPAPTPTPGPGENDDPPAGPGENDDPPVGPTPIAPYADPIDPESITYARQYPYTDENGAIHIRYLDVYTIDEDNEFDSVASETVTSTVCGTETPDSHVVTVNKADGTVTAVGCGTAEVVSMRGMLTFIVEPSPINMLFVTGQSNASGDHSGVDPAAEKTIYEQYVRTEKGMAFFTFSGQTLDITGADTLYNPRLGNTSTAYHPEDYVVTALRPGCNTRYSGKQAGPAADCFAPGGSFGNCGWCAGLAHGWVEQTGERVWVVNASHGGHPINNWIPADENGPELLYNDYEQAVAVFNLALRTLYNEVDAGHYTLSHMAYYWMQGESDSASDDLYYFDQFAVVHRSMQEDVVYDHAGEKHELEFCGVMTLRSCRDSTGNSLEELYMIGPRLAQYAMNDMTEGVFSNVYVVSNVTEEWVGGDANVKAYFENKYGTDEAFRKIYGYAMPTTMKEVHPNIHYWMAGHNEMGVDAAKNTLLILNRLHPESSYHLTYEDEDLPVSVKLLALDGYTEIPDGGTLLYDEGAGFAYVIPRVTPYYRSSLGVSFTPETAGVSFDGFRMHIADGVRPAEVTFVINVHGVPLARYTLKMTYGSALSSSLVRFANSYGGDYNPYPGTTTLLDNSKNAWTFGYYTYSTGAFVPYDTIDADSWFGIGGQTKFTAIWHGGVFLSSGCRIGASYAAAADEDLAVRYTVKSDGTVGVMFDQVYANLADIRFAIYVNGEKVAPDGWFRARSGQSHTTVEELNEQLSETFFDVKAGDEVYFVFAAVDDQVAQALIYPVLYYVED